MLEVRGCGFVSGHRVHERRRHRGVATLRLDTRGDLVEARTLYASLGYQDVPAFNGGPYAEHWLAKTLH